MATFTFTAGAATQLVAQLGVEVAYGICHMPDPQAGAREGLRLQQAYDNAWNAVSNALYGPEDMEPLEIEADAAAGAWAAFKEGLVKPNWV